MTGWDAISILIISAAVLAGLAIIMYGAWSILTNKTFLALLRDFLKNGEDKHE